MISVYLPTLLGTLLIVFYFRRRVKWMLYTGYGIVQLALTLNMTSPMLMAETSLVKALGAGLTIFGVIKVSLEVAFIRHLMANSDS